MGLTGKRVVITGGAGFLGSYVVEQLQRYECEFVAVPRSAHFDLRSESGVQAMYEEYRPDVVLHLAAVVGGIGANMASPGSFFYDNLVMGIQLMEYGRRFGIEKFVSVGTICAYPKHAPVPFRESELWNGYPEETNAPYGLAKKMLLVQAQAYRQEFGFNSIYLLPVNLYGPRDNFDLETSHVIPAMIRKCLDARDRGDDVVEFWGDGSASREFLYAEDAATGILLAAERYDGAEPVNLGTGQEITIRELAEVIKSSTGFGGSIRWDSSRPNGQPRRCLDTTRARERFGFEANTSFESGISRTVAWYEREGS